MTNSTIGILGSGRVGMALAHKLASSGHDVMVGSRTPAATAETWIGPAVRYANHMETARDSAIIINATPGDTTLERLTLLRAELDGKILVDVANATARGVDGLPGNLCYPNSSLAEHLQHALPRTRVVKTLNTMLFTVMVDPHSMSTPPTAFLSGDDDDAKAVVSSLLGALGWPPEWIMDLGASASARGPEAVMLLAPHVLRRYGFAPFAMAIAR